MAPQRAPVGVGFRSDWDGSWWPGGLFEGVVQDSFVFAEERVVYVEFTVRDVESRWTSKAACLRHRGELWWMLRVGLRALGLCFFPLPLGPAPEKCRASRPAKPAAQHAQSPSEGRMWMFQPQD